MPVVERSRDFARGSKPIAVVLSPGCILLFAISQSLSGARTTQKAAKTDPALATAEKVLRAEAFGRRHSASFVSRKSWRSPASLHEEESDGPATTRQAGFDRFPNGTRLHGHERCLRARRRK